MSSPPLAPDDGPIDFEHLSRMTLGDPALECEVLTMFVAQSAKLLEEIASLPPQACNLAHTLKGSSRAIGAFAVAEAAARLETALAQQGDARASLDGLSDAITEAHGAIEAFLSRGWNGANIPPKTSGLSYGQALVLPDLTRYRTAGPFHPHFPQHEKPWPRSTTSTTRAKPGPLKSRTARP